MNILSLNKEGKTLYVNETSFVSLLTLISYPLHKNSLNKSLLLKVILQATCNSFFKS